MPRLPSPDGQPPKLLHTSLRSGLIMLYMLPATTVILTFLSSWVSPCSLPPASEIAAFQIQHMYPKFSSSALQGPKPK